MPADEEQAGESGGQEEGQLPPLHHDAGRLPDGGENHPGRREARVPLQPGHEWGGGRVQQTKTGGQQPRAGRGGQLSYGLNTHMRD